MNFNELLVKDGPVSIHHQNLQKLTVKIFKVSRGLSPEIVNQLVFSGTENLGPKIWVLVSNEMKQLESLGKFRHAIKQWKPTSCPCR